MFAAADSSAAESCSGLMTRFVPACFSTAVSSEVEHLIAVAVVAEAQRRFHEIFAPAYFLDLNVRMATNSFTNQKFDD